MSRFWFAVIRVICLVVLLQVLDLHDWAAFWFCMAFSFFVLSHHIEKDFQ